MVTSDLEQIPGRILVIGLGNELLTDDGVGVHAARRLKAELAGQALVVEVGTGVLNVLHLLDEADRILAIDAMQAGGAAGQVYTFTPREFAESSRQLSIHELSLVGALRFLPPGRRARQVRIIGVEPQVIEFGLELSETVLAALPQVAETARQIVGQWRQAV